MEIERRARPPRAAASRALLARAMLLDCLGCPGCSGCCAELAEVIWLPQAILKSEPRS